MIRRFNVVALSARRDHPTMEHESTKHWTIGHHVTADHAAQLEASILLDSAWPRVQVFRSSFSAIGRMVRETEAAS